MNANTFSVTPHVDSISTECYKAEQRKYILLKHNIYNKADKEQHHPETKEGKSHKAERMSG